jgi:hypothetical protein
LGVTALWVYTCQNFVFQNVTILMTTGWAINGWISVLDGLPEDDTPVPKYVAVDLFVFCIL